MDLNEQITGLESDLKEVTRLLEMSERQRVQDLLSQEQKKIEKDLAQKQQQRENQARRDSEDKADTIIIVSFTDRSFNVLVKDLEGKNYQMTVNNLLCPIVVEESSRKVKTDMVLVMCKKKTTKKWEWFTQVEKQSKEKDKPSYDENADPGEGLMNMLKKIYSEGDDEMKRTINKAWAESQEKKAKGDEFDF
ncbi:hypothetical protein AMELA_G00070620 [Ameiurus melas]|uniref:Calcyclin-binding protein n=1 Tax=Ameiurus melas TaxID=219545 RepID=A0A7J6B5M6_AMEME|nr:hypothetical protein AMELA_G00070620 [Ameiurus melas]